MEFATVVAPSLTALYLPNGVLEPSTLDGIAQMRRVGYLNLANNPLLGGIPAEITKLVHLSILDLSNCSLTERIPASLREWPFVDIHGEYAPKRMLMLGGNQLFGPIPLALGRSDVDIWYIDLSNNLLRGPLPGSLVENPNLYHVDVSNNRLSGALPDVSATHFNYRPGFHLNAHNNAELCGAIP